VRLQRTNVVSLTAEAFNAQTGVVFAAATCNVSSAGSPNDGGSSVGVGTFNGDIAYIRVYNTTVAVGTIPANTTCIGQLLDFEFENNGADCSGNSRNLIMSGASYVTTPSYNPAVGFNSYPRSTVFSTTSSLQLTSTSFSATDNSVLTYAWSQIAPIPATGTFSSNTASSPTFSSATAGTYGIQLIATDSAMNSNTTWLNVGAANTNGPCGPAVTTAACIVNDGLSSAMHNIIGPQLIANTTANPWTYDDIASLPTLQNLGAVGLASPFIPALGSALSGTVTAGGYSTNGALILGSGTSFFSQVTVNSLYVVAWNSPDGNGTGRGYCAVSAVTDNTHLMCGGSQPFPSQTGLTMYNMARTGAENICNGSPFYIDCWVGPGQPSNSIHYYDVPLALYRAYVRTGNSIYLTYAQQFADIVWQWVLDHGYAKSTAPRNMSMISQYYRALELGGSALANRMAGLAILAAYLDTSWYGPSAIPNQDLRDGVGYPLWSFATGARTDPNSTQHSTYCGYLTASTSIPALITAQNANGGYSEHQYVINPSYVDAPKAFSLPLVYEGAPWRQAITLRSMEAAYEVLADTSAAGCNQPTLAASLLTAITSYVSWMYNYGRDTGNRGIFYEMDSASNDQATIYHPPGTVSVTNGSTALVGVGTHFVSAGYLASQPFIGFDMPRTIYKLNACSDDTHCTLNMAYGSLYGEVGNLLGDIYSVAPPAAACGNHSLATWCYTGTGDRNLTRTVTAAIGWLYNKTQNATYKAWADEFYSATMGGPTSGLTASNGLSNFNTPCSGPACDGYTGDSVLAAPTCNVPPGVVAPCVPAQLGGTQNFTLHFGKDAGEAWGATDGDNWLAWRLLFTTAGGAVISGKGAISGKVIY